jgi:hypothetical protein
MSVTHSHPASAAAAVPFTEGQLHAFHEDDKHAGGAVIVLMAAIFTIGLVLYSVIAIVVSQ